MTTFRHGIHPAEHKADTEHLAAQRMPFVGRYVLPLGQNLGAPSKPVVQAGQRVARGQLVAEADGFVSVCISSPVTGTVTAIGARRGPRGDLVPSIEIEADPFSTQRIAGRDPVDWRALPDDRFLREVQSAGLVGLFGMPRSAPVVGGLTLALMTLPVIIIASRAAIAAVPVWIRESARGLGASPVQVVAHQVLPIAMPGIVTGTLLGLARAMGETAPLLMIGMVAFIVDVPTGFTDAASALPVQIFLWADSPERGFVDKVSGAILVLLTLLGLLNGAAILLRQRFEQRW